MRRTPLAICTFVFKYQHEYIWCSLKDIEVRIKQMFKTKKKKTLDKNKHGKIFYITIIINICTDKCLL